ncbi:PIN domain-containing protein [Sphingobacterium alkalisoli]|uniref:PIN domain-containing protein n=1 Tax=Sphingobacterium alkalisoli TaxID=1874115 RepID=A0A4U0H2V7_9SPHI|nr:PIN domain-containing protein [Sphingobacterium alkalisoli]TJY65836.1 PIN domain-containing protein [Sphingobacterium alkalisoli]GGH18005.1 PIN domain-containing protein [Sphingobacterium alkalisoli]
MIHSVRFTAVLDTNVIYPVIIRDLLLWFAHYDMYTPKWSANIFEEWKTVMVRKGIPEEEAKKRIQAPNAAFPDAFVLNYEGIIPSLTLPDPNDCHVLAAAIKSNANVIVTNNIKDFPKDYLNSFGVGIKTADDFLTDIIDLNHEVSIQAFREMVVHKKNPKMDVYEVLDQLRKSGLTDTANYLHSLL